MCQLLGLTFNLPARPDISFRGFMRRGKRNPHGWGLALYPDGKAAQVFKEPAEAGSSQLAEFLRDYPNIKSTIFIGHVRFGNIGGQVYRNTHPFERVLGNRDYVFAHNGTLHDIRDKESNKFVPIGETDSEWAFCAILDWLGKKGNSPLSQTKYCELAEVLRAINEYGHLNVLMSDGEQLFCYYDKDRYNGLWYVQREFKHTRIKLIDEDWTVDLGRIKEPGQKGYVIATKPLTDEEWTEFGGGQLIVFSQGELVFQ